MTTAPPLSPGKRWGLRRLADPGGRFKILAADQRPPIKNLVANRRGLEQAPYEDVAAVKALLVRTLGGMASAVLIDPHYGYPAAIDHVDPAQGLLLTLEDSVFTESPGGRRSSAIDHWSVAKIKRLGADAVKVLAWYRPDADEATRAHQQEFVADVGAECTRLDIPFVFELLDYALPGEPAHTTGYVEHTGQRAERVIESVVAFADPRFGVDLFKLESPVPAGRVPDPDSGDAASLETTQRLFDALAEATAGRPWVMLSAGATAAEFRRVLAFAYRAGANGYLAGRAIWWEAFQSFPDLAAMEAALEEAGVAFMRDINALTDEHAVSWRRSTPDGSLPGGTAFRSGYPDFAGAGP